MTRQELTCFAFTDAPFSKEIEDSDLWLPPSKTAIVALIVEAVEARKSILLDGEPGVGKTCILRALRAQLKDNSRLTYCHNSTLGRRDFYRTICQALGLAPKASAAALFWEVTRHIEQLAAERKHPVLLLDEAHLLHQDVLDHLHILCNYEWDSRALLSLLLVGLPELRERLCRRHQRSLYSRIAVRIRIDSNGLEDTTDYLRHRLQKVGATEREYFTSDAIALLHEAVDNLRDLDRLAEATLREAFRRKKKLVERDVAERVIEEDQLRS